MTKVAVIIPYYQDQPGILARCLASVFAQDVDRSVEITVFIIDDASPVDPARDIAAAGEPPANVSIRILRRDNGGPAAARNTGLEDATRDHEVIACIDSDDSWRADHLSRALMALSSQADLYFSDFRAKRDTEPYLQRTRFCRAVTDRNTAGIEEVSPGTQIYACDAHWLSDWAVREYLAQTSTIVYRTRLLGGVRFSDTLRLAGEDHLFFLDLVLCSVCVAFSLQCEVELGAGINIYEGSHTWGGARDLQRRTYNLGALRLMRSRANWSEVTRRLLARRLAKSRRTVGFLLIRQMLHARKVPMDAIRLAWHCDRSAVLMSPFSAAVVGVISLAGGSPLEDDPAYEAH